MRVMILPEDFVKDEQVLLPIIKRLMAEVGRPRAKVLVCKDPRFHGTSHALKWEWIEQALDRHRGMVDLFLLCVDRDGEIGRRTQLDRIEALAAEKVGPDRIFLAENAWQELEVWILAGHDLPREWDWNTIRAERDPKEYYFQPFAERRGVLDQPGQGRGKLAIEAAARYDRIRSLCKEDVLNLESRIKQRLG